MFEKKEMEELIGDTKQVSVFTHPATTYSMHWPFQHFTMPKSKCGVNDTLLALNIQSWVNSVEADQIAVKGVFWLGLFGRHLLDTPGGSQIDNQFWR